MSDAPSAVLETTTPERLATGFGFDRHAAGQRPRDREGDETGQALGRR